MIQSDKLVWRRNCMQIGLFPIIEVSVWFPDTFKHGYAQGEGIVIVSGERQSSVNPRLPKVAIHGVSLEQKR